MTATAKVPTLFEEAVLLTIRHRLQEAVAENAAFEQRHGKGFSTNEILTKLTNAKEELALALFALGLSDDETGVEVIPSRDQGAL